MTTEISLPSGTIADPKPTIVYETTDFYTLAPAWLATFNRARLYVVPASTFVSTGDPDNLLTSPPGFGNAVHVQPSNGWLIVDAAGGSLAVSSNLPFGELKAVLVLRDTTLNAYFILVGPTFSLTDPPETPTGLTPANSSTVDTNFPTLGATIVASGGKTPVRAEWQLATDAGFTTNVRTIIEAAADARASGPTTEVVPAVYKLFAGTWYVRVRAKNAAGDVSAWSSSNTFTVAHLPSTTAHSPSAGQALAYNEGFTTVAWRFRSTSPDLTQSAYRIVVETTDGDPVLDTTKVTSTDEVAVLEIEDEFIAVPLRWKVQVWDSEDVSGSYSDWQTFILVEPGEVAITAPTEDEAISAALTVEWTFTPPAVGVQAGYRVIVRTDDENETVIYDSGLVVSADADSHEVPGDDFENSSAYTVEVIVYDSLDLVASDTETFSIDWTLPDPLPFTVEASLYDTHGPVTVLVDGSGGYDIDFILLRVRRRRPGGEWVDVGDFADVGDWVRIGDFRAAPGSWEYEVRQVAERFGGEVLSAAPEPVEVTVATPSSFWVFPDADAAAVSAETVPPVTAVASAEGIRLEIVTDDPHATEVERAVIGLHGRGRKVETGTVLGRKGSLSFTLLDDAHDAQLELEALVEATPELRKPNGEMFTVSYVVDFTPQGRDDYIDVSLAYEEVG